MHGRAEGLLGFVGGTRVCSYEEGHTSIDDGSRRRPVKATVHATASRPIQVPNHLSESKGLPSRTPHFEISMMHSLDQIQSQSESETRGGKANALIYRCISDRIECVRFHFFCVYRLCTMESHLVSSSFDRPTDACIPCPRSLCAPTTHSQLGRRGLPPNHLALGPTYIPPHHRL